MAFFGTPAFAVPSLDALLSSGCDVVAVVTQPDRPQGRSRSTLVAPPVKDAASARGIPVLQPERPVGDAFERDLAALAPDLAIVVAYGHLLRPHVLAIPRLGMVNVHASLLPRWRGAAPIAWAIAAGDRESGVSIMRMTAGLDSGPVWAIRSLPIGDTTTAGELTTRLSHLGAALLVETLPAITSGVEPQPQDEAAVTLAPKVGHHIARLDWSLAADELARRVRAFDPAPGAWTMLDGTQVKFFGARSESAPMAMAPAGTVLSATDVLRVATGGGVLVVHEVHPAGKRRQPVEGWLRGRGIAPRARFE